MRSHADAGPARRDSRTTPRVLAAVFIAALLSLPVSCGDDGGGQGPVAEVDFHLDVCGYILEDDGSGHLCSASRLRVGQSYLLTAAAHSTGGATLEEVSVEWSGLESGVEPVPIDPSDPTTAGGQGIGEAPTIEGTLTFEVLATAGGRQFTSLPYMVEITSTDYPKLADIELLPPDSAVRAGGEIGIAYTADVSGEIGVVEIACRGAATDEEIRFWGGADGTRETIHIPIPDTARISEQLWVRLRPYDRAGSRGDEIEIGPWTIADVNPPQAHLGGGSRIPSPAVPGDVLTIEVYADDSEGLTWVGYEFDPPVAPPDSVPAVGGEVYQSFEVVVEESWIGDEPLVPRDVSLMTFARDASSRSDPIPAALLVLDAERAAYEVVEGVASDDARYDPHRDRVYFLADNSVMVLDLASLSWLSPYELPNESWGAGGFDFAPDGSLLFVSYSVPPEGLAKLATFDPDSPGAAADVTPFDGSGWGADDIVATADGRVFVTLRPYSESPLVWELNLGSGDQGARSDAGGGEELTDGKYVRSLDGSTMLLRWSPLPCCPPMDRGQVWTSETNAFGSVKDAGRFGARFASADVTGQRFLIGGSVLDHDLNVVLEIYAPWWPEESPGTEISALSADGSTAYFHQSFPTPSGEYSWIIVIDVNSGTMSRRLLVPSEMTSIIALPDGERLVGRYHDQVYIVAIG